MTKISRFVELFETVISLNYDLLVYWAMMESNSRTQYKMKDCFSKPAGSNLKFEYNINKFREEHGGVTDPTLVFYPHGNLILAIDEGGDEIKIANRNMGSLIGEIINKWMRNYIPLFVSEGSSEQKLRTIRRSAYLNFVYESVLPFLGEKIVIYGWKMAEQDEHLIDKIFRNGKVREVCISVYIDTESTYTLEQERVVRILERINSGINIRFYNAASTNCWCS